MKFMTFDTLTIAIVCALFVISGLSTVLNPLLRRPKENETRESVATTDASISIILAVHDGEEELERNLPLMLSQDYNGKYEVIVVDESSTDDTAEVLKRMKNKYDNLYATFIPESSHYISRRKLALTVGVKAAKYDWLLFTDADCRPADNQWLKAMASHCNDSTDLVLGGTLYEHTATSYERFERIVTWWSQAYEASRRTVYSYCGHNMLFRRSLFDESNGFLSSLQYLRGEYDFLANEYGRNNRTAVAADLESTLLQDAPTRKRWVNDHIYSIETCKHLDNGMAYRLVSRTQTFLLHLNLLADIAAIALSAATGLYIITIAAAILLLAHFAIRIFVAHKAMKGANETIGAWKIPFMELFMMWRNLRLKIKHFTCDKYDFIRR